MKNLLLFLFLLTTITSSAQITITDSDMPQANQTIAVTEAPNILLADPSNTGANYFWNYSFLKIDTAYIDSFQTLLNPTLGPYLIGFFDADYGKSTDAPFDISAFVDIEINNPFDFYRSSSSAFEYIGFGVRIQGLPVPFRLFDTDVIYKFPLSYGNVDTSTSHWEAQIPTIAYWERDQERENYAEGWGKLRLPNGEYDVLKVRTILNRTDSTYVDTLGFGLRITQPEITRYQWLAKGYKQPILEIEFQNILGLPVFQYAKYYSGPGPVGRVEALTDYGIQVFPNPVIDQLMIQFTHKPSGKLRLLDLQGKVMTEQEVNLAKSQLMETEGIPPGVYFLEWSDGNRKAVEKLVIQ